MAKTAVTLAKVAREANCSTGAVSNILKRNDSRYSEKLREQVFQTAKKLGYQPNAGARAMKSGKFGTIAFVTISYGRSEQHRFAAPRFIGPVTEAAAAEGMSVLFEPLRLEVGTMKFLEPPRIFTELCVDGIIAVETGGFVPPELDNTLIKNNVPVVWINRKQPAENMSLGFCPDELDAGRKLTRELVKKGHTRIGYFGVESRHYSAQDRLMGVVNELGLVGLESTRLINLSKGGVNSKEFSNMVEGPDRVTAIICYDYAVFNVALYELGKRGMSVPGDISLCYFANEYDRETPISATCVVSSDAEIGAAAFGKLNQLISAKESQPERTEDFKGELVIGDTVSKPSI